MRIGSGYIRLSDKAEEEGTGLATQPEDLKRLAEEHGIDLRYLRVDDGKSGDLYSREAFERWLDDVRTGDATNLLAWKFDRVSRAGFPGLVAFYNTLEGKNAQGVVVHQPARFLSHADRMDSDSSSWTIHSYVMAALSKSELDAIKTRARRSMEHRRAEGRFTGGVVPVGLKKVPNPNGPGSVLVPDEKESAVLIEAAERILQGEGLSAVTRYVGANLAPRKSEHWRRGTVRSTLLKASNKEFMGPAMRAALKRRLADVNESRGGRAPAQLLSTLLLCGGCEGRMTSAVSGKGLRCYRCTDSPSCEARVSVSARLIEETVLDLWRSGWGQLAETERVRVSDLRADEIARLEDAIAGAQEALGGAGTRAERLEVMETLDGLEEALGAAQAQPATQTVLYRETGRTWGQVFAGAPMGERREILRKTLGSITVSRGRRGVRTLDPGRLQFEQGLVLGPLTGGLGGSSPLV